jgi:large subunit ribosomal protein L17
MTRSLIEHERIITTEPKAKELRPFIEHIITLAKRGIASNDRSKLLHARRLVQARLGPVAKVELYDNEDKPTGDTVVQKLFDVIAPRYADRPGGYTRIIKRSERRLGDAGKTAFIELLKDGETKVMAPPKPFAPKVVDEIEAAAPSPVAPIPEPVAALPTPAPEPEATPKPETEVK